MVRARECIKWLEKDLVLNSVGQSKELCILKREIQRKFQISVCEVLCSSM